MGIYDLAQKKVLFEPQFLDVTFRDNGDMEVEVFDEELGRTIEKIIDPLAKSVSNPYIPRSIPGMIHMKWLSAIRTVPDMV